MIPTIWPRRRSAPIRLAENANDDYPAPLSEGFTIFTGQPLTPAEDPSYCCEECEAFTARIRRARQAVLITEFPQPQLERELVELEARHALARLAECEVSP